ncbi:hypothetical protein H5410_047525 [Solanum commersonii]|uniref:Uncharacterized protein n=1 Tax=Solanum commersonii TaxID=4109 RepID=A0A9J5XFE0_SOLCO|nr:hypothetical protein H5410_047525 [Solanum commersonii]
MRIFKFKRAPKKKNQILSIFFFMDVRYNLINGVSWSRGEIERIFKFKQALKQEKLEFIDFHML